MGWILAAVLAGLCFGGLYFAGRCSRLALEIVGAALLLALAGYGWQGSPDLPGNPVAAAAATR